SPLDGRVRGVHCACLLVGRCVPMSAVFPYTTLFRSQADCASCVCLCGGKKRGPFGTFKNFSKNLLIHCQHLIPSTIFSPIFSPSDRKSTRLNSSHVSISYAVFCLKKKNITRYIIYTH